MAAMVAAVGPPGPLDHLPEGATFQTHGAMGERHTYLATGERSGWEDLTQVGTPQSTG